MPKRRAPRIVTVALEGRPIRKSELNVARGELMAFVLREVDRRWDRIDAVLFPGGYFRLPEFIGHRSYQKRVRAIEKAAISEKVEFGLRSLSRSPSALAVVGMTSPAPKEWPGEHMGDQFCGAWSRYGIVGLGRKIFPVSRGGDPESSHYVCNVADFAAESRIVRLASGDNTVLCACYDMFGVAETAKRDGLQARGIWWLRHTGDESYWLAHRLEQRAYVDVWQELLRKNKVTVALSTIHLFRNHGTSYWQRHGIATAAARIQGYALGTAHFAAGLPASAAVSVLASRNVPKSHLSRGTSRACHGWEPKEFFYHKGVLLRLFTGLPA